MQTVSIILYKINRRKVEVMVEGMRWREGIRSWSSQMEHDTTACVDHKMSKEWSIMDNTEKEKPRERRRENPIFTIWVHTGYAVLILSMIAWMVYMEFFMWFLFRQYYWIDRKFID